MHQASARPHGECREVTPRRSAARGARTFGRARQMRVRPRTMASRMHSLRGLLASALLLAVGSRPTIGAALPWLNAEADHSHTASLAIDHGELHLLFHHGAEPATSRAVDTVALGEPDHELEWSDPGSGVVAERRDTRRAQSGFLARPTGPGRAFQADTISTAFAPDPGPAPNTSPPVLRI